MTPSKVIIHHSATVDGTTFSWSAIKRYHVQTLGWLDIGYHAGVELVDDDYFTLFGRPWDMDGAHTQGQNGIALGLCFVGNYDLAPPPNEMLVFAARHLGRIMKDLGIPADVGHVHKHGDFAPKTCPGTLFPFAAFLGLLRPSDFDAKLAAFLK